MSDHIDDLSRNADVSISRSMGRVYESPQGPPLPCPASPTSSVLSSVSELERLKQELCDRDDALTQSGKLGKRLVSAMQRLRAKLSESEDRLRVSEDAAAELRAANSELWFQVRELKGANHKLTCEQAREEELVRMQERMLEERADETEHLAEALKRMSSEERRRSSRSLMTDSRFRDSLQLSIQTPRDAMRSPVGSRSRRSAPARDGAQSPGSRESSPLPFTPTRNHPADPLAQSFRSQHSRGERPADTWDTDETSPPTHQPSAAVRVRPAVPQPSPPQTLVRSVSIQTGSHAALTKELLGTIAPAPKPRPPVQLNASEFTPRAAPKQDIWCVLCGLEVF